MNLKLRLYLLSVVYRNLILKKKTLILISKILTHAILLPFHIKNLNQSNGHELIERKKKEKKKSVDNAVEQKCYHVLQKQRAVIAECRKRISASKLGATAR